MERYLTEHLHVPTDRIQLLLGSEEHTSSADPINPSRANIIGALFGIIDNSGILSGDNIIIFYAGHGSCFAFEGIEGGAIEHIEALCPIDRDTIGDDGQPVPDISDREFNTILTRISQVKGHCITVILDCCYSGKIGVTRNRDLYVSRIVTATSGLKCRHQEKAMENLVPGKWTY